MAKKESTFLNMLVTLFAVAFLSSTALGLIYEVTKKPIAKAKLAKKVKAIKEVVPEFTNDPVSEKYIVSVKGGDLVFFPAKKDGTLVGTAIETFTQLGFGGTIKLIVGLLPDGSIYDIAVLEHKETPGLGDKMEKNKSDFSKQFKGMNPASSPLSVSKDGGDIDGITAATISSRAFCDAVQRAYDANKREM